MRKLIITSFLLLVVLGCPAFALIVTDNVDKDNFHYEVAYSFCSADLVASLSASEMPVDIGNVGITLSKYYTVPRDGCITGIAVSANDNLTAGYASFDVTINGVATGIRAQVSYSPGTAKEVSGKAGTNYSYLRQDRKDIRVGQGFYSERQERTKADCPYGIATAITAGNKIGVRVTTSSGLSPTSLDYVVTVYVQE